MRIISKAKLKEFWDKRPQSKQSLEKWHEVTKKADWSKFGDIKNTFNATDKAKVCSGRTVEIFDVGGNKYRLIVSVHYNRGICYVLKVLTHAEHSKNKWKGEL